MSLPITFESNKRDKTARKQDVNIIVKTRRRETKRIFHDRIQPVSRLHLQLRPERFCSPLLMI